MSASLEKSATTLAPCILSGVKIAACQNCIIAMWETNATSDFLLVIRKLDEIVPTVSADYPDGLVFFVIAAAGAPMPNSADRRALEAFFTRWGSRWRAVARVAEGSTLWAIAARSMMTALVLVKRGAHPESTFATGEEAAEWLGQYLTRRPGQDARQAIVELNSTIQKLRSL